MELRVNYSPETEQNIDLVEQFNLMEKLAGPQVCNCYGLFTLPYSDTNSTSGSKPNGCIVVCAFHTVLQEWDWNQDQNLNPDL